MSRTRLRRLTSVCLLAFFSAISPVLGQDFAAARIEEHWEPPTAADAACSCTTSMNAMLPSPTPSNFHFNGTVRRYYITAEEIQWDYAPSGWDNWLGVPFNASPRAAMAGYVATSTKWTKAVYRGYTDETFSTPLKQPPWQGLQGPTLRCEVGDLLEILFVNRLSKNYASMHSMGLAYEKSSEGSVYPNNTAPGQESPFVTSEAVPPGGCSVYKWMIPDTAAPATGEDARTHAYHSYVSFEADLNAGLIGPQMVYHAGDMKRVMNTYREFPLLYMTYNETRSFLSGVNSNVTGVTNTSRGVQFKDTITGHHYGNQSVWQPQLANLLSSHLINAPTFYALNGYIFSNNPVFDMCEGDKVIWYLYAMGSDTHVFHMHGNGFKVLGHNKAAIGKFFHEAFSPMRSCLSP